MFDMANDSGLFHTATQLQADGWTLTGNIFEHDDERMLPLYEAKMFHHFNHRWATYIDDTTSRDVTPDELADPTFEPMPRYWVHERDVAERRLGQGWFGWRKIARATDMRQLVCAALPDAAFGDSVLLFAAREPGDELRLQAVSASFALDFIARQKLAGANFNLFLMEQVPFPPPTALAAPCPWDSKTLLSEWLTVRAGGLCAVSWSSSESLGYNKPLPWDTEQRESWRTELDAAMFHVYGYSRDEVAYVMDTFPIVARKDRKAEGLGDDDPNWRTKRLILATYDELARHAAAGTTYVSPDPPPPLPDRLRLRDADQSTCRSAPAAAPPRGGVANG